MNEDLVLFLYVSSVQMSVLLYPDDIVHKLSLPLNATDGISQTPMTFHVVANGRPI